MLFKEKGISGISIACGARVFYDGICKNKSQLKQILIMTGVIKEPSEAV